MNHSALRSALVALGLLVAVATPIVPAEAQPTALPGVGEVGQGVEWTGFLEPAPLSVFDTVQFDARGLVGGEGDRLIGTLSLIANAQVIVARGRFPALGGDAVRVELLDGDVLVTEVVVETEGAASKAAVATGSPTDSGRRRAATAPVTATGVVTILPGAAPTLPRSVRVALFQFARSGFATREVVPAPMLEIDLGMRTPVEVGNQTFEATTVRFLASGTFPPPGSSSAILERVDVFTGSGFGGVSGPTVAFVAEVVEPGVLFSGVPVQPDEGTFDVLFDHDRGTISGIDFDLANGPIFLITGEAAGVSVAWQGADLAAGFVGSSAELAAIGQNVAGVEVRGVVTATRTSEGWELAFQPPGGLGGVPRTVEVDGEPVGEVTVPAPGGVFARVAEPPTAAAVYPMGLGEGALYGFSWDTPASITVPGAGTFTGREVRLVFPSPLGPLAFGGLEIRERGSFTLTGLAAPAEDDGGPCIASATRLCLAGGRFAVEAPWADPHGGSGQGVASPLSADTGAFWFFDGANLEVMVKVLDACPVNGHFWVFAGGLTNVEVELVVTDTRTGVERRYPNPQGRAFQPIQDTAAFATCGL